MLCYAKSLQSCPTLCDPIDGSPPGSPVPGILQARTLEWVTISFSKSKNKFCKIGTLLNVSFLSKQWMRKLPIQNHGNRKQKIIQFSSVTQSCLTLCNPMNHSMPGLPVHHQLPEFTQTHFHRIGDAIQPSHPLSSPSRPAPNPSQHQSFPMSQLFA